MTLTNKFFIAGLALVLGFASPENEVQQEASPRIVQQASVVVEDNTDEGSGDCFDAKMEKWYVAFNYYQEQGYDMKTADEKAVKDSENEFKACQESALHLSEATDTAQQ